jgi:hypothetical protein
MTALTNPLQRLQTPSKSTTAPVLHVCLESRFEDAVLPVANMTGPVEVGLVGGFRIDGRRQSRRDGE